MDRDSVWELRGNYYPGREDGHPATLKTMQMERVVEVEKGKAMHLRVAAPQGIPFSRWPTVGCRLRALVEEGPQRLPEWSMLSDAEQEAACAEFLRERHADRLELPILKRLLLPVGRGMEDVDVYALTDDGNYLYAQVTHRRSKWLNFQERVQGEVVSRIYLPRTQVNKPVLWSWAMKRTEALKPQSAVTEIARRPSRRHLSSWCSKP
jgi:hypothetical protein